MGALVSQLYCACENGSLVHPWLETGGKSVLSLTVRASPSPGGKAGKSALTVAASLILFLLDLSIGRLWQSIGFPNLLLAPLTFSVWLFCSGKLFSSVCSCQCPQWGHRVSHLPIPWESGQSACIFFFFLVCTASSLLGWCAYQAAMPTRLPHTGLGTRVEMTRCHVSFPPCLVGPGCPGFCYIDA